MRAAEEPPEVRPRRKGLKAQALGRIEEFKAREREREELVAEFVPAMEARGYDTGPVRTVMGG